ncbi:hypothetical protein CBS101457_000252 [Exobasidium rhododendri]|nr:hypothetical protein CBS101457_000252 [Exobasidium rhododendri]
MTPQHTLLIVTVLLGPWAFLSASPVPAPVPMDYHGSGDGHATSRYRSDYVRQLARTRRRQQERNLHGEGGEYASSLHSQGQDVSESMPLQYYPDLFHQHPEGIGARLQQTSTSNNESSYNAFMPDVTALSLSPGGYQMPQTDYGASSSNLNSQGSRTFEEGINRIPSEQQPALDAEGYQRLLRFFQRRDPDIVGVQQGSRIRYNPGALCWARRNGIKKARILEIVSQRRGILNEDARVALDLKLNSYSENAL